MVDLPYRFVPTLNKLVNPVRIVAQGGHNDKITAIAFSPCTRFFASADSSGCVKIWAIETRDILGSYLMDFTCTNITWENLDDIICSGEGHQRKIMFMPDDDPIQLPQLPQIDPSRIIRLLGAPEYTRSKDSFTVTYNDHSYTYDMQDLIKVDMDPCERYVVAVSQKTLLVVSAFENEEIIRHELKAENTQWLDFSISPKGDVFTAISDDGTIWFGDPIRKSFSAIFSEMAKITAHDFAGNTLAIMGNSLGIITLYHISERRIILRTPRLPKRFSAVYPSPQNIGFIALRPESASAFLGYSKEILSAAPLPAAYQASCPGNGFAEVIVACEDNIIYRLNLDSNEISKITKFPHNKIIDLACAGQNLLICSDNHQYDLHNGEKIISLPEIPIESPTTMAVSENGKMIAVANHSNLYCSHISGKNEPHQVEMADIEQIAFGKDKTANILFIFKSDLTIQTLNTKTGEIQDLNRLIIDFGHIISVAPAAKNYLFVLLETEHGQKAILKVGLNSGKSEIVLRIFTLGTQIWAAATDDQTINIRHDANCLRIIAGLKAYSIDDWSRSEPFLL